MSIDKPTPIELAFQSQSLERMSGRLYQEIIVNGELRFQLEKVSIENGTLKTRLRVSYWFIASLLAFFLILWSRA